MVSSPTRARTGGPGRQAPARLLCAGFAVALTLLPTQLQAQARQAAPQARPAPQPASPAVPDQLSVAKLVWSTMAAVDHANKTGNYSVLRDLGSLGFQANNNPATLAAIFTGIRERQIDLTDTLAVRPVYEFPPQLIQANVLRIRGSFAMRPMPIQFDMLFEWNNGWRLEGIAVNAVPAAAQPAQRR